MKVFISHSSREDPLAAEVRNAIRDGLVRQGHEVFVDMDVLAPGDNWRSVLYHWLAECDAAVVLLSRAALQSYWVRREVNILLWRAALGEPLAVVPAIIGGLADEDLRQAGFGELMQTQAERLVTGPEMSSAGQRDADVRVLAGKVIAAIGPAALADPSAPMATWASAVAAWLEEVKQAEPLVAAAKTLQVAEADLDQVRLTKAGCRFLAHQLLAHPQGLSLAEAMADIAEFTPVEALTRLIKLVSATWVNGEAARLLLGPGDLRPAIAVLNAKRQEIAMDYVNRAMCNATGRYGYEPVTGVTGEASVEEFRRKCTLAVHRLLHIEDPEDTIEDALEFLGGKKEFFLIVDPAGAPSDRLAEAMKVVRQDFPWLTIVLLTGADMPADADLVAWRLERARKLEPALKHGDEKRARFIREELHELAKSVGRLA